MSKGAPTTDWERAALLLEGANRNLHQSEGFPGPGGQFSMKGLGIGYCSPWEPFQNGFVSNEQASGDQTPAALT